MLPVIAGFVYKLRHHGFLETCYSVYRRILPKPIAGYENLRPYFFQKIGLEIGGPSEIFTKNGLIPIYRVAKQIDNCVFSERIEWAQPVSVGQNFQFDKLAEPGFQYIGEGGDLSFIDNSSYDFILSSHSIEHMANPIKALFRWAQVLKKGGVLVLVVPNPSKIFDHRRAVTSMEHLVEDFNANIGEEDLTHLEEILELHDLSRDSGAGTRQEFRERSLKNHQYRCLHHHVLDKNLISKLIYHIDMEVIYIDIYQPSHIIAVALKNHK